jgi:phospholipid/cholesterol/gamma-HCH transport system substrate-binding protein
MSEESKQPRTLAAAPPGRGQGKTLWVGLFVVVGLVGTLGALFVLTDAAIFRGRYVFSTQVPDAGGIRRGDPVQMRGVNIGRVLRFKIGPQGGVDIQLEIEGEYKIPRDSQVKLKSSGPLQPMIAEVIPGTGTEYIGYGDRLPGSTSRGLGEVTDRLADQAEQSLDRVQRLLSDQAIEDVHGSTAELQKVLKQLSATVAEQREQLRSISASLRNTSQSVEKATGGPELERTVKRLDSLTARMDTVVDGLHKSSDSLGAVMTRIEKGEGTLGKLSTDAALYDNLNQAAQNITQATENINKLTEEIRRNPRKYLKVSVF